MTIRPSLGNGLIVASLTLFAGCKASTSENATSTPATGTDVMGAGSTFVYPLFTSWFSDYNRAHPDVRLNYQSIGSGGGVQRITEKSVDFGATDGAMSDAELAQASGIVHVPVTSGAVVIAIDLPGVDSLNLTPDTLAGIFLGQITNWSDPLLAKDNPETKLPHLGISVIHRSDGSGTTAIFTDYLSKISSEWRSGPGAGKSVKWPVGRGFSGNNSVSVVTSQTSGAIGYVEFTYAKRAKLTIANLRNRDGVFVHPSLEGISAAAAQAEIPADFRVSITDAPGKGTWPISGFTWVLIYEDEPEQAKGDALLKFLWWAVHDGQQRAAALDYAPLPLQLIPRIESRLKTLKVRGNAVLASATP